MKPLRLTHLTFAVMSLFLLAFHAAHASNYEKLVEGQLAFNNGNFTKAFKSWRIQAIRGEAEAQVFVGLSYNNGWGVNKDLDQAAVWFRMAADQGNASAQFLLGIFMVRSDDKRKVEEGAKWLHKAAQNGDGKAYQFLLKARDKAWFSVSDELLKSFQAEKPLKVSSNTNRPTH